MQSIVLRTRPRAGAHREAFVSHLALETLETRTVPAAAAGPLAYDPGHVLVCLRDGVPAAALGAAAESLGGQLYRVGLAAGATVPQTVAAYGRRADVLFAEPDAVVLAESIPNDPRFVEQWGLNNTGQGGGLVDADIDAPQGWDVLAGRGRTIVAVIDSGIDISHPDLAANIWRNPGEIAGNGIDDDRDGFVDDVNGWNFLANTANVADDYGHGTHVAGIIGAVGGNGIGVTGVDQHVQLMPLKFLNAGGSGLLSNAALAVNYAVAHGAGVINMSTGGLYDAALRDAIANARAAGVVVVAAAGNQARNTDTYPTYPAGYPLDNIVSVAALDNNDQLAAFSNYGGASVDIAAPGVNILSTTRGGGYGLMSGTSMAAPFVAGAIALVRDSQPGWTYQQAILQVLGTASRIPAVIGRTVTGGILNLARTLLYMPPPAADQPPAGNVAGPRVMSAAFGGTGGFDRVRVTFSGPVQLASLTANGVGVLGPAGTVYVTSVVPVAGSGGTQFDIAFPNQTRAGTYAFAVAPGVRDLAGNAMNQNGNGVNGEPTDGFWTEATLAAPGSATFLSADAPAPIRDLQTTTSNVVVDRDLTVRSVKVRVNLTHTFVGDLILMLESPAGQKVTLFQRRGYNGDNLTDTVFDSSAAVPIAAGLAPFAGSFAPESSLGVLNGSNARGVWKLTVEDKVTGETGTLNGWSLLIE